MRPLGLAGIPCAPVVVDDDAIRHSRFAVAHIEAPDGHGDRDALVGALIRFAEQQPVSPVLFYENDEDLALVSEFRERLGEYLRFVVADRPIVDLMLDKARFQDAAERLGLPVPRGGILRAGDSLEELDLGFPIVVKPLSRRFGAWSQLTDAKALRLESDEALRGAWPQLAAIGLDYVVQELVPGPERRIESYHVYVRADGTVAGEFTGRKIRTGPVELGHSTALETTDAPDVAALGREVIEGFGVRGVAKVDFKRDPAGRLRLLEVNPRFNLWHHLGAVAGVNLPALVYADLAGGTPPIAGAARAGRVWCNLPADRRAAREAGMSTTAWLPWALRVDAKSPIAWDDPMPFLRGRLWPRVRRFIPRTAGSRARSATSA
jgi:D-aspartate ligase